MTLPGSRAERERRV